MWTKNGPFQLLPLSFPHFPQPHFSAGGQHFIFFRPNKQNDQQISLITNNVTYSLSEKKEGVEQKGRVVGRRKCLANPQNFLIFYFISIFLGNKKV
jgi:hypothetical protein